MITIALAVTACTESGEPQKSATPTLSARADAPEATTPSTPEVDPTALTYGGTASIQAGTDESSLSSVGIRPLPAKAHGCNRYPVPGAPYLDVYAAKGRVLGVKASPTGTSAHTFNGIRIGSTAAEVRAAFSGSPITEQYSGLASTNLMLVGDGSGKYLGFMFPGNRDASKPVAASARVQSIDAGTKSLASGFEVCSG